LTGDNGERQRVKPAPAPGAGPTPLRRFYTEVTLVVVAEGHSLRLDGRMVRTPLGKPLVVPVAALAEAIAEEWRRQGERIEPGSMPMTRLANTAIDRVAPRPADIMEEIVSYAASDLLLYRAEGPAELVRRQERLWDPVLAWAAREIGARFVVTTGVMHVTQPELALRAVRGAIAPLDPFTLTSLHNITTLTGSALLGLALALRHLGADEIWQAALVDEDWNREQWGTDPIDYQRRAVRRTELDDAARFLVLGSAERD